MVKELVWSRRPMSMEKPVISPRSHGNASQDWPALALPSLVAFLQQTELVTSDRLGELTAQPRYQDTTALLRELVQRNWLTAYQANQIAHGDGQTLAFGPYRVLEPIGQGGMGKVYKALHVRMDRIVALKVIPDDMLRNSQAVARFFREVRAVSRLSHPNIVTVYEVGQEGKTHYFAMEYIEGIDLGKLVLQSGPLAIPQACDYIRQTALGLQHAHEKGLVHRDIKPGNLVVGRTVAGGQPHVKILDFGLARFENHNQQMTRLTRVGHVIGTVDYLSPEQAGDAREVDIRADIYSLGCSLFYLLTGKPPFEGADAVERLIARVTNDAPSVRNLRPEVWPSLEAVLARMLARNPEDRYSTPAEVAAALEPFALPSGAIATAVQLVPQRSDAVQAAANIWGSLADEPTVLGQKKPTRRWPTLYWAVPACVVVIAVVVAAFFLNNSAEITKPPKDLAGHREAKLEKSFTNSIGMEFVLVPKGKSWLGGGGGKVGDREVEIMQNFYLGKYEVTQDEWQKVMGNIPSYFKAVPGVPSESPQRFPVETVSWDHVQDFITRLQAATKEADLVYRLPKQVEWEYACRGGPLANKAESGFDFYLDKPTNQLLPVQANFGYGINRPRMVGSYQPNRLGLHDMHGNVFEWCQDGIADPKSPNGPALRFLAGGCWRHEASKCRAADHHAREPDLRHDNVGFRLARFPTDR